MLTFFLQGWINFEHKHPVRLRSNIVLPPDIENMVINDIVLNVIVEETMVMLNINDL